MSLIDQVATFRGRVVDLGVNLSSGGFEQCECKVVAEEIYDDEEKVWVDYSQVEENEITAYLILFGKKGATLNVEQLKKVFNLGSPFSFQELGSVDYSETKIQFRTKISNYEGKDRIQVDWIDEYDAEPGRSVRKLDASELKQLDAKYASLLKQSGKAKIPVKAPVSAPATSVSDTPIGAAAAVPRQAGIVKKAKSKKPASPPKKNTTTMPDESGPDTLVPGPFQDAVQECTMEEAFGACAEGRDESVDDAALAKAWLASVKEVGGGKPRETLTPSQWYQIKEKVLSIVAKF